MKVLPPEDHTTIWGAMGNITEKLIIYGAVLEKLNVDGIMKEAREAHLITASIRKPVENSMSQATSSSAQVGSMSASLNQPVTLRAGGRLYVMHQYLNAGDQNIGVLQQNLTEICNVAGTLE